MSYLHRVTPNKNTTDEIEGKYNEKGQLLDANTKEVLVRGKIDRGHKHGYEERVMRECAERCHMTQKEYSQMMQNSKLYQFESSHNNRTHKFESNDRKQQLHNCFEVIRDYKGKNRNKTIEKYGESEFTYSKQAKNLNSAQKSSNNKNANIKTSGILNGNSSHGHSSVVGKGNTGFGKAGHSGGKTGGAFGVGHSSSSGGHGGSSGGHGGSGSGHGGSNGGHGGSSGGHGGSGGGHGR